MALRLAACLLNISEGRRLNIIEKIACAACNSATVVLNIFSDYDYNRSVLTIAAQASNLQMSVVNACKCAYEEIDLRDHNGGHPRLGAVDLVPIYPISPEVSLKECGDIAQAIGKQIVEEVEGSSVFFFGTADNPRSRGLVERRKEVGWYKGKHSMPYGGLKFDVGNPPSSRYGLTGVGASPYVMNCNVTIETQDMKVGHEIAKAIRGSTHGGLTGVQAMAFGHEGSIEIACNVEAFLVHEGNEKGKENSQSSFSYTTADEIKERVQMLSSSHGIAVKNMVVVAFRPEEVYQMAYQALSEGNTMAWKTSQLYRM